MERISNDMQRVQANQGNSFMPSVHARYPKFLPATQIFRPFFRFLVQSHFFYRRFARFLRQICGWTTPVGLPCCYDSSSCHQSIPPRGGGGTSGFIVPTVEPHRKVRWRAVARRSSQLKPYLPALPSSFLGGRGPHSPQYLGKRVGS